MHGFPSLNRCLIGESVFLSSGGHREGRGTQAGIQQSPIGTISCDEVTQSLIEQLDSASSPSKAVDVAPSSQQNNAEAWCRQFVTKSRSAAVEARAK